MWSTSLNSNSMYRHIVQQQCNFMKKFGKMSPQRGLSARWPFALPIQQEENMWHIEGITWLSHNFQTTVGV